MSDELREALGPDADRVRDAFENEYGDEGWDWPVWEREREAFVKGWIAGRSHYAAA